MKAVIAATVVILAVVAVSIAIPVIAKNRNRVGGEQKELLRLWEAGSFEEAFTLSKAALEAKPMDYFLLTMNGFAAFQLGEAQINTFDTLNYLDECITSLRKALLLKNAANDGRVYYVLGKAYRRKGDGYADLAVEYLEKARSLSYHAADINEDLGLAYAAVGDYRSSVAACAEALEPAADTDGAQPANLPDLLLLSIARSYAALDELESARAYLLRCIEVSLDSKITTAARLLLAEALGKMGDIAGSESEYAAILADSGENAEAHYQLGELYSRQKDEIRARAEWRLAVRADPAHAKARSRLNM
jgi:tetratricopeptide (TPR) repeat protein